MNGNDRRMVWIKLAYWLGIGADALWVVGLLFPAAFRLLVGISEFDPDIQVRLIMGMGGSLMAGWTLLLLWAIRQPIERRVVILLTAFPVVFGMFIVALFGFLDGNIWVLWLLIKSVILMVSMTSSYVLACKLAKETRQGKLLR